jgi:hypothetical protein
LQADVPLLVVPLALFMIANLRSPLIAMVLLPAGVWRRGVVVSRGTGARPAAVFALAEFYLGVARRMLGEFVNIPGTRCCSTASSNIRSWWRWPACCSRLPRCAASRPRVLDVIGRWLRRRGGGAGGPARAAALPAVGRACPRDPRIRSAAAIHAVRFSMARLLAGGVRRRRRTRAYATRTSLCSAGRYDPTGRYHGSSRNDPARMQALAPERRHEALTSAPRDEAVRSAFKALRMLRRPARLRWRARRRHWRLRSARAALDVLRNRPAIERIARSTGTSYLEACGDRCVC